MVITKMLASSLILALTASIPSVSRRMRTKSSHSNAEVPSQMPKVLASIVCPRSNASDDPSRRESMYDLPVLYGPQMDRTARGFLISWRSDTASSTTSNLFRGTPSFRRSWFVFESYSQSFGIMSGREGGSEPFFALPSLSTLNFLVAMTYYLAELCGVRQWRNEQASRMVRFYTSGQWAWTGFARTYIY